MGCPLAGIGTGFVLGSGDPTTAQIALMLEAPGREELTVNVPDDELERRRCAFPNLDDEYRRRGMPVVGKAGSTLWQWGLAPVGISRESVFVDNGLRCLPPKEGNSSYPKGDVRKRAEACCRIWDRWNEYKPTVALVNIHPAAIARDVTPLPLMIKVFEKAKDLAASAERPLVLCGGKSVRLWMGYAENVTKWSGHYQRETEVVSMMREKRRLAGMEVTVSKEKKAKAPKKLTAKEALKQLLASAVPYHYGDEGSLIGYEITAKLSEDQFKLMSALVETKGKK